MSKLDVMMKFREMLDMFRQGKASGNSHIKNLIEMATADGVFADEEETLLKSIAFKNGISAKRMEEIRMNPENFTFELPESAEEKFNQLHELVYMMVVDNEIHADELRLIELFAIKFGYARAAIPGVIKIIKRNIENGADVKQGFKDVQYYLEWAE